MVTLRDHHMEALILDGKVIYLTRLPGGSCLAAKAAGQLPILDFQL